MYRAEYHHGNSKLMVFYIHVVLGGDHGAPKEGGGAVGVVVGPFGAKAVLHMKFLPY